MHRLAEIVESLHRSELSVQDRSDHIAEHPVQKLDELLPWHWRVWSGESPRPDIKVA